MAPTSTISRSPSGLHELKISGRFHHPHWLAHLFSALAKLQISIVSGRAHQAAQRQWDAAINLNFSGSSADPDRVDYSALAQQITTPEAAFLPKLSKFQISRQPDQQLQVLLEGPDQIGFLARLLGRLSLLGLFPTEFEIDTVAGQIKDRIVLRSIGDTEPSETERKSLETMLQMFIVEPAVGASGAVQKKYHPIH